MPAPAALTISVPKTWRYGMAIDFTTPTTPSSYNVYINSNLFRNYPLNNVSKNATTGMTRILLSGFPTNEASSSVSVQVSYIQNGIESSLSGALSIDTRRVLDDTTTAVPVEAEYFI